MQAARFSRLGGPEALEIVDLPDLQPRLGQVRTTVRAAGANASDLRSAQRVTANAQSSFSS
jgi:NADPH:quinone reductase-like Zn-dependent oxidoreductase